MITRITRKKAREAGDDSIGDCALKMLELGAAILPCPKENTPITLENDIDGQPAFVQLAKRHWRHHPNDNYAIMTGYHSEMMIAEINGNLGRDTIRFLRDNHCEFPISVSTVIGNKEHWYFRCAAENFICLPRTLGPGVTVLGDGGCVIGAGSVLPDGSVCRYAEGRDPVSLDIAWAPSWLFKKFPCEPDEDNGDVYTPDLDWIVKTAFSNAADSAEEVEEAPLVLEDRVDEPASTQSRTRR